MKYVMLIVAVFAFAKANSQDISATASNTVILHVPAAEKVVEQFFQNFHAKDTTALRTQFSKEAYLQSLVIRGDQRSVIKTDLNDFLNRISSIPPGTDFKEELTVIKSHGNTSIASVHADYTFYMGGKISHRGTNVFTMVWTNDQWVITQITDTRIY